MRSPKNLSLLDRFLRLFTDTRAGEGLTAVLLALNVFLILTAYYILKPVREALILSEGTAEMKSYVSAGQVLVLIVAVKGYAVLTDRMPRRRLINVVTAFFVGCLVVFYVLAQFRVPLGIAFFLWVGIFNVMIIAQFWSFANDVYDNDEGERLFPIVQFGASAGAVLGAVVAGRLIEPLGTYQLMLVAAVLLALEVLITNYLDERERQRREGDLPEEMTTASLSASGSFRIEDIREHLRRISDEEEDTWAKGSQGEETEKGEGTGTGEPTEVGEDRDEREAGGDPPDLGVLPDADATGAFALLWRHRYLLLIALLILFLNWVNTTGEYILGSVVEDAAEAAVAAGEAGGLTVSQYIGRFYSDFYAVVNLAGLLIQLFLVSRIVKYLGVRIGMLILPLIALGAYGLIAFYPVLALVRWAKTAENSTDYSLQNTLRHMLFLPTTREQKYKAKQAIDSFFWRAGDVLSAAMIFVGTTWLAMEGTGFARVNVVLVAVWLVLAFLIGRRYHRLVTTGQTPR